MFLGSCKKLKKKKTKENFCFQFFWFQVNAKSSFSFVLTIHFFYKNIFYKNIEAENGSKIKNILRIYPGSAFYSRYGNLYDPVAKRTEAETKKHYSYKK